MTPIVYLNGRFVPEPDAHVSVYDGAFLHGAGLFETMRAENARVFRLEAHLERLIRSAARLLVPIQREALPGAETFRELLDRNQLQAARIRLTVSAGSMREGTRDQGGSGHTAAAPTLTVCATAAPAAGYAQSHYESGVSVAVCGFRLSPTDPLAGHKTTSYLPRLLGLREAMQARCMEAIWFTTNHQLAEGSISNVFIVRNRVVKTPPLDTPVLPGIARGVVLEIAPRCGFSVEETPLTIDDLLDADEVFLTNSIMQVMPVVRVEKHDITGSRVGDVTRRLLDEYRELVRKECGEP